MRLIGVRVAAVAMAILAVAMPAARAAGSGFVRAEGAILVDGLGRQVLLRGLNHIGLRSDRTHPSDPHAAPSTLFTLDDLDQSDFDAIAALGLNSIRLVVSWEFAQPDPPPAAFNETYFALIDSAIARAAAAGMTTIFDFAQFGWGRSVGGNAGAPAWTVPASCSTYPQQPGSAPPQTSPRVGCVFFNFWTNGGGLQDRYIDLWRFVAARYASNPHVSMYDLFNEPVGGPIPPAAFEHGYLYPFYERLAEAIRQVDPNHAIAFQPAVTRSIGVPAATAAPLSIPNSIYAPHSYTLAYLPQRADPAYTPANLALMAADSGALLAEAAAHGTPMVIGENGWTRSTHADGVGGPIHKTDPSAPPKYAADMAALADELLMSWHWFAYSSIDEAYGVNYGGVLDEVLANALARPFPRATAGRLVSVDFDPATRVYRQVTSDSFDADSEISLPMRAYPNGAFVRVDGVTVATIHAGGSMTGVAGASYSAVRAVLTLPSVGYDLTITAA